MSSKKSLKNWSLGYKLNAILALILIVLLFISLILLNFSLTNSTRHTGQQEVLEQTAVMNSRFAEAERDALTGAKLMASNPAIVEAVAIQDPELIWTTTLASAGALHFDKVNVVNADGAHFKLDRLEDGGEAENDKLLSLGLLGIEATGIVSDGASENPAFLLAAAIPLRDSNGTIIGALQAGNYLDDDYLSELNFGRENIHLALIRDENLVAQTTPELTDDAVASPPINIEPILNKTALKQALGGQTAVEEGFVILAEDMPATAAYMPLTVGTDSESVLAIFAKVGTLTSFQNQLSRNMAFSFVILTLSALFAVAWFTWRFVAKPLRKLQSTAEMIAEGNYEEEAEVKGADEIGQLAAAFNHMNRQLRSLIGSLEDRTRAAEVANKKLEIQIWNTTGQARLNDKMRGDKDLPALTKSVVQELCHYLDAQVGALYIAENDILKFMGGYAYGRKKPVKQFKIGEGLVGQAAMEKELMLVKDVPQDSIIIRSGLSESPPNNILLVPIIYQEDVKAVLELGTLQEFSQAQTDFLQTAVATIGIAINTTQTRARIDELLAQTQIQAEELQAQGEELRVTNEELEEQTISLRSSEARLRENQHELEAINTQLEDKATALEESTSALKEKQISLDKQNQELKKAQNELEQKAEELALSSRYKSEFLANMSHELRTPLNSLLILAHMLVENEEGNLTDDQVESAQIIYNGGNDLLKLINDILDLSKVESGKMDFHIEPTSLIDLISPLQTQFAPIAAEKGIDFNINLADDLPECIETDPQRASQIIKNLLSNAIKFTQGGSVKFQVYRPSAANDDLTVVGDEAGHMIAMSVKDTGIGLTPEQSKIIFEAFKQADGSTSRQYGGTGLGLSISRELAFNLGGHITVDSKPGQGSVFTLYLPISYTNRTRLVNPQHADSTQETAFQPDSSNGAVLEAQQPFQKLLIPDDRNSLSADDKILLIIEDDPNFAKVVYDFSHKHGFQCLVAGDGNSGLSFARAHQPQAIILDLHLPDITGWIILDELKSEPTTRHIPVHIISVDEEMLDAYHKGAMGYLTKPVSKEKLDASFQDIDRVLSKDIKSLLIVEDDIASRVGIKKLLDGNDIQISEADRGQAALDLIKEKSFDCIILDLSLPDMSGFEVLSKMNGHTSDKKCPIIIYTGRELTPEENNELMKYADSIIVKGVRSPERLLDETALFLHRVVADMTEEKQNTIRRLYNQDSLLKGKKVLIVDDDMRNSFALSKLLSEKGMSVKIAPNGQDALDLIENEPVDLVLMDIMMPVMDGFETTKRIRQQPEFKSLPILALTAKAMKGDRDKCLAAGANDYLSKPVDVDRLFSLLRVWLYQ